MACTDALGALIRIERSTSQVPGKIEPRATINSATSASEPSTIASTRPPCDGSRMRLLASSGRGCASLDMQAPRDLAVTCGHGQLGERSRLAPRELRVAERAPSPLEHAAGVHLERDAEAGHLVRD